MALAVELRQAHADFWRDTGRRVLRVPEACAAFDQIAAASYGATVGQPEMERKAAFLERFAEEFPVVRDPGQRLSGSRGFGRPAGGQAYDFRGNHGHVIIDYGRLVRCGVDVMADDLRRRLGDGDEHRRRNRAAMLRALVAFSRFVERHGPDCQSIAHRPAATFGEGLQLVWLAHVFLFAEGCASAFSFGRFDQYLGPLLEADLAAGRLTLAEAEELLTCFWFKACEGCESQNLTLGGVDEQGRCAENTLSVLALEVTRKLRLHQPSVSVRLGEQTSERFLTAALELCRAGFGMPSFFNDEVVIAGLAGLGLPLARARDWGVVGCYEATPQGDSAAFTVAGWWSLPAAFREFFDRDEEWPDVAAFRAGLVAALRGSFAAALAAWDRRRVGLAQQASPFESACLGGCAESGLAAEEGGSAWPLLGVNVLGFGTLVDSVRAVEELVYTRRALPLAELRAQVLADYPDEAVRLRCRQLGGRYGSGSAATGELASWLSDELGELFDTARLADGSRLLPGLFWFGADIMRTDIPATPDGRRLGEPCSYGAGPSASGEALPPTAVLASVATVRQASFPCGAPVTLALSQAELRTPAGLAALRGLLSGYFAAGGSHLHVNTVAAETLRAAQAEPGRYGDLLVRVSGFSAKFTALDRRWQDVLIERTEQGL